MFKEIKLTEYSHGAGCGCKISPEILDKILHQTSEGKVPFPGLLVGNDTRDDAAVLDLGTGQALVSTTDFFMPIVDNPFDFGRIASVNALSDIYAMGGRPILALAILGWPISKLSPETAAQVLEGSRYVCAQAGIPLAGGHSIDCPEPIFGLSVNGLIEVRNIKKNSSAKPGNLLYLTKKLGVGILTTAQKRGILKSDDLIQAVDSMTRLNILGTKLGNLSYVECMTDVTGFGLLGHLLEICEGSAVSAEIFFHKIPVFDSAKDYFEQDCIPGGTHRNWNSYGNKISPLTDLQKCILSDPQTSGGLLIAVDENKQIEFENFLIGEGFDKFAPMGKIKNKNNKETITVS
jgi:selenide,water dikinase